MAIIMRDAITLVTEAGGSFRVDQYGRPASLTFMQAFEDQRGDKDDGALIIRGSLPESGMYVTEADAVAFLKWLAVQYG